MFYLHYEEGSLYGNGFSIIETNKTAIVNKIRSVLGIGLYCAHYGRIGTRKNCAFSSHSILNTIYEDAPLASIYDFHVVWWDVYS